MTQGLRMEKSEMQSRNIAQRLGTLDSEKAERDGKLTRLEGPIRDPEVGPENDDSFNAKIRRDVEKS